MRKLKWSKYKIEWVAKSLNRWREFVKRREARRDSWGREKLPYQGTEHLWREIWCEMMKEDPAFGEKAEEMYVKIPAEVGKRGRVLDDPAVALNMEKRDGGDGAMMELMPSDAFGGRNCDATTGVLWAGEHLAVDNPSIENCPGPLAWQYLWWARQSDENRKAFNTQVLSKAILSRSDMEKEGMVGEDQMDVELKRLLAEG